MNHTARRFGRGFTSLSTKLLIAFTIVFTVVFAASYYWFYASSTERALGRITLELTETIQGVSAGLDGALLLALFAEGEPNDAGFSDHPAYLAQMAWFRTVQSIEPRAWPYTFVQGPAPNEIYALADLWSDVDPSKSYAFLEVDQSTGPLVGGLERLTYLIPREARCAAAREALAGAPLGALRGALSYASCLALRRVGHTDAYGSWVSAYMPVLDAQGERVGGVGVDFEMELIDDVQNAILAQTVNAFLITYVVLLALVLVMSRVFIQPIVRLTAVAERVGEGDYEQDFGRFRQRRFRDEIGVLAEVIEGMTEKVRSREHTLRREVQQLRIEIDESKRSQQVEEIVETDFFRELQAKAQQMRERGRKAGEATP